jgi:hypothetical protein
MENQQQLEFEDEEVFTPANETADEPKEEEKIYTTLLPDGKTGGAPLWAKIPKGMKFPRARQAIFIRFEAKWTDSPQRGERQCICWGLTDVDEKFAISRAMGDPNRAAAELTKQMIRAIDGVEVDWDIKPGTININQWWREIGGRCRQMLIRIYTQLHTLTDEERQRFFEECISVVIPSGG